MSSSIHPYKGYINTLFHIYVKGMDNVSFKIVPENSDDGNAILEGIVPANTPYSVKIQSPGEYDVIFSDGNSSKIFVEDGYKFGGSKFKNAFIFDNTPWCFIIMNDRTYFYNRDNNESYVEVISPDNIFVISSDYVIFENTGQSEQTIYSLKEQRPILNVPNIVSIIEEFVIYQEQSNDGTFKVNIFSFFKKQLIRSIDKINEYIIDPEHNDLIYTINENVFKLKISAVRDDAQRLNYHGKLVTLIAPNLVVSLEKSYYFNDICLFDTRENKFISRIRTEHSVASVNSTVLTDINLNIDAIKNFEFSSLNCPDAIIDVTYESIIIYPTKWDIFYFISEHKFTRSKRNKKNTYTYKLKSINSDQEFILSDIINEKNIITKDDAICFYNFNESVIFGKNFKPVHTQNTNVYVHNNNVISTINKLCFELNCNTGWIPLRKKTNLSFKYFEEFGIMTDVENRYHIDLSGNTFEGYAFIIHTPVKHLIIGETIILPDGKIHPNLRTKKSDSGTWGISVDKDGILLLRFERNQIIIKEQILSHLYDTSSFHSVLLSEDGSQIMYRDEKKTIILDLINSDTKTYDNLSYIKDINGIRPLFDNRPGSLQPRLVNPVTGQTLSSVRMSAYQFVSPNGILYADTELKKYIETWNLINNKLVNKDEIIELSNKYSYKIGSELENDIINKKNRKKFIVDNLNFFKESCNKNGWVDRPNEELIDDLLTLTFEKFSTFFLEERGVAYIKNTQDNNVVAKIQLGHPLWFLNYVSFSYDNRYVAIAGRYPDGCGLGGLFLIYDLINKRVITSKTNSWAVWVTSFNKDNVVASYSSEPITYKAQINHNDKEVKVIQSTGYSFLTFSPDGKYIALSNQGYVSKYDRHGNERKEWGHRPSCEVFIVKSSEIDTILENFSDLSQSGIEGMSDRKHNFPKTVSSASFSNNNKQLMMVGNDGVVVVRNLHLEE